MLMLRRASCAHRMSREISRCCRRSSAGQGLLAEIDGDLDRRRLPPCANSSRCTRSSSMASPAKRPGAVSSQRHRDLVARISALWLSQADLDRSAAALRVDRAAIKAVYEVEAGGGGFLGLRPKILFEGHVFWRVAARRRQGSGIARTRKRRHPVREMDVGVLPRRPGRICASRSREAHRRRPRAASGVVGTVSDHGHEPRRRGVRRRRRVRRRDESIRRPPTSRRSRHSWRGHALAATRCAICSLRGTGRRSRMRTTGPATGRIATTTSCGAPMTSSCIARITFGCRGRAQQGPRVLRGAPRHDDDERRRFVGSMHQRRQVAERALRATARRKRVVAEVVAAACWFTHAKPLVRPRAIR